MYYLQPKKQQQKQNLDNIHINEVEFLINKIFKARGRW